MLKGGYQIIDFNDHNHTVGVGAVHEGIYDKIEGTRKAILLSGIVVGGTEYHDMFVFPTVDGSNFVMTLDKYTITVEDTDVVTITEI